MHSLKRVLFFFFLIPGVGLFAQNPVNAYANVTAIAGAVLNVNSVNETFHTFEDGDYIIIMQMQDNVIGANTTNASTFGDLSAIQSAGLFEVARIASHTEVSSLPATITLSTSLVNTYNINANASVQIITFRQLGANYTTVANIGTLAWNGTVGGVTAIFVPGVFTLAHSISANGCGFAGGVKNTPNGYSGCDDITYATTLATRYAGKGEGIYKRTVVAYGAARGKILNGGGGGNDVNAGGGGGGNYTSGGGGGSGWTPSGSGCSPIAGGIGGISLSTSISGSRLFMGGGGGAGHENDGVGTVGGAGGGIILIKAGTFSTTSCGGISISASGITPSNAANDGAGGGGAGGSVLFNVGVFNIAGACPVTISANGGNGGNSNASSSGSHGGGGGGGQGVVIFSAAQPVTNVTTNTIPGAGGVSCSGCSATQNGAIGSGTSNSGIITNGTGPLPVELTGFKAFVNAQRQVVLEWSTAVEKNSAAFIVQRMSGGNGIEEIAVIKSKGNNSKYSYTDVSPPQDLNYYRLKQVDLDGVFSLRPWVEINLSKDKADDLFIYPNPLDSKGELLIKYPGENNAGMFVELINASGEKIVNSWLLPISYDTYRMDLKDIPPGVYVIRVKTGEKVFYKKLLVTD